MPLFDFIMKGQFKFKKIKQDSKQYELRRVFKAVVGQGNFFKEAVKVPQGENANEWIAMNTIELYNTMNLCYGIVSEACTDSSCPKMTAGPKVTYYWSNYTYNKKAEKPVNLSAPEYTKALVIWISEQLDNPAIFPTDGSGFGKNFLPTVQKILNRMFRVYAHIYHHHWEKVKSLNAESHFHTCFKHFYFFTSEFQMMDQKDLQPMQLLIEKI